MRDTQDSQFALLGERRFGPFFVTQFLGAFNDNAFKTARVLLVADHATTLATPLAPDVLVGAPLAPAAASPEALRESVLRLRGERR